MARLLILFLSFNLLLAAENFIGYRKVLQNNPKVVAHILEFDPTNFIPFIVLGGNQSIGLETVASMAKRNNAIAAINGGFYKTGLNLGASIGHLTMKKKPISTYNVTKGAIGWSLYSKQTLIDQIRSTCEVFVQGYKIHDLSYNEELQNKKSVLYSSEYHRSTLTPPGTKEFLLDSNQQIRYLGNSGDAEIPRGSYILSLSSSYPIDIMKFNPKSYSINFCIHPMIQPEKRNLWEKSDYIMQAGPLLVKGNKIVLGINHEPIALEIGEKIQRARTAIGTLKNGNWLIAVIEATATTQTHGMTLHEIAKFMLNQGCVDAINLDGGGSSTLVYQGQKHFSPSSIHFPFEHKNVIYMPKEGDRPVGNGIAIIKRG